MVDNAKEALAYISAHFWLIAWLVGWAAALGITQSAKLVIPVHWTTDSAERIWTLLAILTGWVVTWMLWPADIGHGGLYGLVNGALAPHAYKAAKTLIGWQFPELSKRAGWEEIRDKRVEAKLADPKETTM